MADPARIEAIIAPTVAAMGYELVRLRLTGGARKTLQVMAEPRDGSAMSLDDCTRLSRAIGTLLDVEDPIAAAYSLEVSSPGIERPLVRPEDFARFTGRKARIETAAPVAGRKRFTGALLGLDRGGEAVLLRGEGGEETIALPLAGIAKAKLVAEEA